MRTSYESEMPREDMQSHSRQPRTAVVVDFSEPRSRPDRLLTRTGIAVVVVVDDISVFFSWDVVREDMKLLA